MASSPTYDITRDGDIVRVEFLQSPVKEDMMAILEALDAMPDTSLRMYVMVKTEILLSTSEVRDGADRARRFANQPRKIAVVAPGNITFGISRIFGVFRESEETAFSVFRDEDGAKAWLLSEDEAQ